MYNLAFDTKYHNSIRKRVNSYGNPPSVNYEPCYDTGLKGGSRQTGQMPKSKYPEIMDTKFRRENPNDTTPWKITSDYLKPGQYSKPTYRSGTGESWSYFGRNYQKTLQTLPPAELQRALKGGATRFYPPSYEPVVPEDGPIRKIQMRAVTPKEKGKIQGGVSKKKLKEVAKSAAKKGVSKALDIGVPAATGALGQSVGIPAPIGAVTGAVAREAIKKLTGFGRGGVGVYSGSDANLLAFEKLNRPQKAMVRKILKKLAQKNGGIRGGVGNLIGDFADSAGTTAARAVASVVGALTEPAVGKWLNSIIDSFSGGQVEMSPPKKSMVKRVVPLKPCSAKKGGKVTPKGKTNPWVQHLKEYSSKHGISYRDALKNPKAREAYRNKK